MKRLLLILSFVIVLTSCEKDDDTPVNEIKNGKAIITGIVRAELDLTTTGMEYAPKGTVILAKIHLNDLFPPDTSHDYGYKIFSTTVGDMGRYTLNIDANAYDVNVEIMGEDFEYNQKVNDTLIVRKIYSVFPVYRTVVDGMTKVVDINYNN